MRITSISSLGCFIILISLLATDIQCLQNLEGSGSGDGVFVFQGSGSQPKVLGSGDGPEPRPTQKSTTTNPDDEGGDDSDEEYNIPLVGSGSLPELGSGSDVEQRQRCSIYDGCWCIDDEGKELPNTRRPLGSPPVDCDSTTTTSLPIRTPPPKLKTTTEGIIIEEVQSSTALPMKQITESMSITTSRTKYVVHTDRPIVYVTVRPNLDGADSNGIFRDDDDGDNVHIEIRNIQPFFTHPGILAAVIGGGVVALLCALLLIMFIVYRMRKKDEGSYPLDPDAKPPRLHTYTRAPNKEFYA